MLSFFFERENEFIMKNNSILLSIKKKQTSNESITEVFDSIHVVRKIFTNEIWEFGIYLHAILECG